MKRWWNSLQDIEKVIMGVTLGVLVMCMVAVGFIASIPKPTLVSERVSNYKIVDVDPPKHVRVTAVDTVTGERHEISLGKHFSNWKEKLVVGRVVELKSRVMRRHNGREYREWPGASETFRK